MTHLPNSGTFAAAKNELLTMTLTCEPMRLIRDGDTMAEAGCAGLTHTPTRRTTWQLNPF